MEKYKVIRIFLGRISADEAVRNIIRAQLKQSMRRNGTAYEK